MFFYIRFFRIGALAVWPRVMIVKTSKVWRGLWLFEARTRIAVRRYL
jgi:hypothetical protein